VTDKLIIEPAYVVCGLYQYIGPREPVISFPDGTQTEASKLEVKVSEWEATH
jgi:hypothetical protein